MMVLYINIRVCLKENNTDSNIIALICLLYANWNILGNSFINQGVCDSPDFSFILNRSFLVFRTQWIFTQLIFYITLEQNRNMILYEKYIKEIFCKPI